MRKNTGITRHIDELGRIVIPKEIRKTFKIKEGDSLEIFTDKDGEIILKKQKEIVCVQCGQLLSKSDNYCNNCGKKVIQ